MTLNFGKYAIVDPVKYHFEKEPDWYWLIKPPTAAAELAVARILSTDRTRVEPDGTRVTLLPTTLEVAIKEIAVTFAGTNIPTSETDPTPILKETASPAEVEALLGQMPREMVLEIWKAVGEACPGWGPWKARQQNEGDKEAKN